MRFEIERRRDEAPDEWDSVGKADGEGDDAAAAAVEQRSRLTGIYRARPAESAESWVLFERLSNGQLEQREVI